MFPLAAWFAAGRSKYSSLLAHFNSSRQSVETEQAKDSQTQDMLCGGQKPIVIHLITALLLSQLESFPSTTIVLNMGVIRVIAQLFCSSF